MLCVCVYTRTCRSLAQSALLVRLIEGKQYAAREYLSTCTRSSLEGNNL